MEWLRCHCIPLIVVLLLHPTLSFAIYETNNTNAAIWLSGQQNIDGSWGATPTEKFLYTVEAQVARLDYIEDPYGNRLTMRYDGSGRLASVVDNLGVSGRGG